MGGEIMFVFYHEIDLTHLKEFNGVAITEVDVLVLIWLIDRAGGGTLGILSMEFTN